MPAIVRGRLPPPSGGDFEPVWRSKERVLLQTAAYAKQFAEVYRPFEVGVAALARSFWKGREIFTIFWGANRKLKDGFCPHRRCGEMHAMEKALAAGCREIVGFVIDGPHQPDDTSGQDLKALMPCGYCRNEFRSLMELGILVTPETRLLSRSPVGGEPVRSTVGSWLAQCGGDDDPAIVKLEQSTYLNAGRSL